MVQRRAIKTYLIFYAIVMFLALMAGPSFADRSVSMALHPRYGAVTVEINGFSTDDEETVVKALNFLRSRIGDISREESEGDSHFAVCAAKYSTKDWAGWSETQTTERNKLNNAYWTYTDFTMAVNNHRRKDVAIVIGSFSQPDSVVGRARIGYHPDGVRPTPLLKIELNRYNFGTRTMSYRDWAGTIYHEFLHRTGFVHPTGYRGSLIKEAGLCVARSFADKPAGFGLTGEREYEMQD